MSGEAQQAGDTVSRVLPPVARFLPPVVAVPGPADESWSVRRTLAETEAPDLGRVFWRAFRYVTALWATGELELEDDGFESWTDFRARIEAGVWKLVDEAGKGQTIAVFTSAGPAGVAAAASLDLDDRRALGLTWSVRNASVTELRLTDYGAVLGSFNAYAHLPEADLVTMV